MSPPKLKTFSFHNKEKSIDITVETVDGNVITSKYCPARLLNGGLDLIPAINGEPENDFFYDCDTLFKAIAMVDRRKGIMERYISSLLALVIAHRHHFKRIVFGDLLVYVDCLSLLLEAEGCKEKEIYEMYPEVTRTIADLFSDDIVNTADLTPFAGSYFEYVLHSSKEQLIK